MLHVAIWHQFILMMLNFSGISDSDAKDQNTNKYHIDLDANSRTILLQKDYKIIANNWFKKENVCVILQKLKHKYLYVSLVVTSMYGSDSYLLNGPLNKKDWLWSTWIFLRWVRKTFKSCHEGCTREVFCLRLIYCLYA